MISAEIEAFIFNFNGKNTVLNTIESLFNSENVKVSITVIDDHSTDESPDLIKKNFPEVKVIILPENTKRINVLRNKAVSIARSEYIFITDNDLHFDKKCLSYLFNVMESDKNIAACTPRLMYWDQPNKIYVEGTRVHFIGASISDKRDKFYSEGDGKPVVNSGSGIALLRRDIALKIGNFDTNLRAGWGNDGEFYQRLLRAGYKCFCVPSAFALHEDKLQVTNRKIRVIGHTYNRWVFILSHYSILLIILLTPVFIMYELFQFTFILMKGISSQYIEGNLLVIKNLSYILKKRRFVQSIKIVSDKDVLFSGNIYVAPSLIEKHKIIKIAVSAFSSFLNFYWLAIKKIIP